VGLGGLAGRLGTALAWLHPTAPRHTQAGSCRASKPGAGGAEPAAGPREHPRSIPVSAGAVERALTHRRSHNLGTQTKS